MINNIKNVGEKGRNKSEKFSAMALVSENDVIFIVVKSGQRPDIMMSVMTKSELNTKAQAIYFSLSVANIVVMRIFEEASEDF